MNKCDHCGDEQKNVKRCPKCNQNICPYCYEDGHDLNGEPCDGDMDPEA